MSHFLTYFLTSAKLRNFLYLSVITYKYKVYYVMKNILYKENILAFYYFLYYSMYSQMILSKNTYNSCLIQNFQNPELGEYRSNLERAFEQLGAI